MLAEHVRVALDQDLFGALSKDVGESEHLSDTGISLLKLSGC